jgi:hypothetical protein
MTAAAQQGAKSPEEKKALDTLVAWRRADKNYIACKDDPQNRTTEYRERGKLRNAADQLPVKSAAGGQP